jgi:hypothetical protein
VLKSTLGANEVRLMAARAPRSGKDAIPAANTKTRHKRKMIARLEVEIFIMFSITIIPTGGYTWRGQIDPKKPTT